MRTLILVAVIACFVALTSTASAQTLGTEPVQSETNPDTRAEHLDGIVVPGSIRARGVFGMFRVGGTLSFRDGMLIWAARGEENAGPYSLTGTDGQFEFSAEHLIENDEHVRWSGSFDGQTATNVTAVWTRVEGDWVHDLLLPEQVTLEFTPDQ